MYSDTAASLYERGIEAIVIGGSAGVLDVLRVLLAGMPDTLAVPVLVVVHLPLRAYTSIHETLQPAARLPLAVAEDKEPLLDGHVYFAAAGYHLLVEANRCAALSIDEPVHFSRPSIDVLFDSASDAYGPALIGILLTGASFDGSLGLQSIHEAGGVTIVQDPRSAEATAMPQAALDLFEPDYVLDPNAIARLLGTLVSDRSLG